MFRDDDFQIETTSAGETADPARFVVVSRHEVLAKLMDALMQGASFVALTGLPGVGKTTMAAVVRELLAARSVAAMHIGRGEGGAIRLRTFAAQLLGKPEDAINDDDSERLFDMMTAHGSSGQRLVIIVDDAELVHTEVFAYLRLLVSIGTEPMPQFLFVGDPSFWYRTAEAAYANVRDLITAWVDLEPLTSAESREFAELLLESAGPAAGAALDKAVLDGLVHASDGLIGRLVSLLAVAAARPTRRFGNMLPILARTVRPRSRLARATTCRIRRMMPVGCRRVRSRWRTRPDPDAAADLIGAPRTADRGSVRSHRVPALVSLAGAVMLAGMVGAVAYRRISVPAELGARAESAMTIEASSDSAHPAPPDAAAGARSEPGSAIVQVGTGRYRRRFGAGYGADGCRRVHSRGRPAAGSTCPSGLRGPWRKRLLRVWALRVRRG